MAYFKFPVRALAEGLSLGETRIYVFLLHHHFRYCRSDYKKDFYVTDRSLSQITGCSTKTVYLSKLSLARKRLIEFTRGIGNKTHYKILN